MQKRQSRKLLLSKETLRTLSHLDLDHAKGGGGTTTTTGGSGLTDTCASCVGCAASERHTICDTYCDC
jgi:hypothetical protein